MVGNAEGTRVVHMPVIIFCAHRFTRPVGRLAGVTVVSCTLAWAGWRWVERPSIAAGKRLCAWLSLLAALPVE